MQRLIAARIYSKRNVLLVAMHLAFAAELGVLKAKLQMHLLFERQLRH